MNKLNLVPYTFEEEHGQNYLSLIKRLYSDYRHKDYNLALTEQIINKKNPSFKFIEIQNFIVYSKQKPVGHIAAFMDCRIHPSMGLFGFYECVDDSEVSTLLIQSACKYLKDKGCSVVKGPIDLSIWYRYRFAINQGPTDAFALEPLTKNYYINQFLNSKFSIEEKYASAQRTDVQSILPFTKPKYQNILKSGFSIKLVSNKVSDLKKIRDLALDIFDKSWNIVPISLKEFVYFYQPLMNKQFLEIVSDREGRPIAFSLSLQDAIDKNTLILKTLGVHSMHQRKGIGSSLLYSLHKRAFDMGYNRFIYALIREGNTVSKFPFPGASIIREYVTLSKKI